MLATFWTKTDEQVVRRVLAGRRNDFGILVQRHLPTVLAVARGHLNNAADLDDVAQESFIAAYQKLDTLRAPEKFVSWLMMIVRNTALNWRRRQSKEVPLEEGHLESLHQDAPPLDRTEMQQMLHQTLMDLPVETREVLLMHYYGGCSLREIAQAIGINRGAASKRLQRARETLGSEFLKLIPEARAERDLRKYAKKIAAAAIAAGALWRVTPAYGAVAGLAIGAAKLAGALAGLMALMTGGFFAAPTLLGWEPVFSEQAAAESPPPATTNALAPAQNALAESVAPVSASPAIPEPLFPMSNILVTPLDQPVGDATVTAERVTWGPAEMPPPVTEKWTTTADAHGSFSFAGLPPGTYSITAVTKFLGGAHDTKISEDGRVNRPQNIKMYPYLRSYGILLDADEQPIAGAVIYPVTHEMFPGEEFDHVTVGGIRAVTDNQGRFRFAGLIPGKWKFFIVSPGYPPFYTDFTPCFGLRTTIVMKRPGALLGRVVDTAGQPVAGIKGTVHTVQLLYSLYNDSKKGRDYRVQYPFTSDDNGLFSINTLPAGTWSFSVEDQALTLKNPNMTMEIEGNAPARADLVLVTGGSVSGRVLNAKTRAAVADMEVSLYINSSTVRVNQTAVTDADGAYHFAGLPEGSYYINERGNRLFQSSRMHQQIQIRAGESVENKDILLAPALILPGRVVDADGNPSVAKVIARGLDQYDETKSDASGGFTLTLREPGESDANTGEGPAGEEVEVSASTGRVVSNRVTVNLSKSQAEMLVLQLTEAAGGGIEGMVLDAESKPIYNVQVSASKKEAGEKLVSVVPAEDSRQETNGEGRFMLSGLTAGHYFLSAYSRTGGITLGPVAVDVTADKVTRNVVIQSKPAGNLTIEGTLYLPSGLPAPMAALGLGNGQMTSTGPLGGFVFKGLAEGTQTLYAAAPLYSPLVVPNVAAGAKGLKLYLQKSAILTGAVINAQSRRPVNDFTVQYDALTPIPFDTGGLEHGSQHFSDLLGRFRMENAPVMPLRITVTAAGYAPWSMQLDTPATGEENIINAELSTAAQVTGVVRNEAGEPLAGAQVQGFTTGADGAFVVGGLPQGQESQLYATCNGYAHTMVSVVPGTTGPVEIVMLPTVQLRIRTFYDGQQVPCRGAWGRLLDTTNGRIAQQSRSGDGENVLLYVPPGTVEINVSSHNGEILLNGNATVTVVAGQENTVDVAVAPETMAPGETPEEGEPANSDAE